MLQKMKLGKDFVFPKKRQKAAISWGGGGVAVPTQLSFQHPSPAYVLNL
jgi:hypothetical protein